MEHLIGDSGTVTSPPPIAPEKKVKKDKVASASKAKKFTQKSVTDSRYDELDKKWTDHFNRFEALFIAKTLQPTFSIEVKLTPSHSPPASILKDSEPFFQPTSGRIGTKSPAFRYQSASQPARVRYLLQSTPEKTPLLHSNSHPYLTDTDQDLHHLSALILIPLPSISEPVSLNQTDTGQDLHLLGTLAVAPLLPSTSQPASLSPTGTDTQNTGSPALHRQRQDSFSSLSSS